MLSCMKSKQENTTVENDFVKFAYQLGYEAAMQGYQQEKQAKPMPKVLALANEAVAKHVTPFGRGLIQGAAQQGDRVLAGASGPAQKRYLSRALRRAAAELHLPIENNRNTRRILRDSLLKREYELAGKDSKTLLPKHDLFPMAGGYSYKRRANNLLDNGKPVPEWLKRLAGV